MGVSELVAISSIVVAAVVAGATVVLAFLNARLLRTTKQYVAEAKKSREALEAQFELLREQTWQANRARVISRAVLRDMVCWLEISNEGRTPAQKVRLTLDRDVFQMGDKSKPLNEIPLFSESVEAFPPGDKYHIVLWPGTVKPGTELVPDEFRVVATYESLGRSIEEVNVLNMHAFEGQDFPPAPSEESLAKLARNLDQIKKTLEKACSLLEALTRGR